MRDRVAIRIAVAFGVVGLVAVLGVGAGLFVSLRTLHRDAAIATLADIAQPIVARVRAVRAATEVRRVIAELRPDLRPEIGLYAVVGDRTFTAEASAATVDLSAIELTPGLRVGESIGGELRATDGSRSLYAAILVRDDLPIAGPVAIVLTEPDTSGALALRDVLRVLPVVALVTAAIAAPIAWLLSRSITRPLRRLADATAVVPSPGASTAPIVPAGPAEVRDLTGRFNAMTAELERLRTEERELLANVRHDLKTPLTVVAGFAEALRDGTATGEEAMKAADAIAREADRMTGLVDNLRALDELTSGGAAFRPEPLDPAALVREATDRYGSRAGEVTIRADADPGLWLVADRTAIERILGNLIDNALAVARPGGTILAEARRAGLAATEAVVLRVSDDGPGFPPGTTDRVFDRFYRADVARTGTGSGLGLSIVRALARAHGGEASAENLAPTGARVTVTLPAVPALADPPAARRRPSDERDLPVGAGGRIDPADAPPVDTPPGQVGLDRREIV
jgi:two-component system sensor histidine kinase BaeS